MQFLETIDAAGSDHLTLTKVVLLDFGHFHPAGVAGRFFSELAGGNDLVLPASNPIVAWPVFWSVSAMRILKALLAGPMMASSLGVHSGDTLKSTRPPVTPTEVIRLFDGTEKCLTNHFDTWIEGIGLNQDLNRVFTVVDQYDGAPALRISGQGFGGLITKENFQNYRVIMEYRWGEVTWGSRKTASRDNGLLLHCVGRPGNFAPPGSKKFPGKYSSPWMQSIELQIIEGGVGDLLVLSGWDDEGKLSPTTIEARWGTDRDGEPIYQPGAEFRRFDGFRLNWWGRDPDWEDKLGFRGKQDVEGKFGEWTHVVGEVRGGDFTYFVNGRQVNEARGCNLTQGRILVQAEGAEIYFRKLELHPLAR